MMSGTVVQGRPLVMLEGECVEGEATARQEAVQGRLESNARSRGWRREVGSIGVPDCGKLDCHWDRRTGPRWGYARDASRSVAVRLGGGKGKGCVGCRLLW